MNLSPGNIPSTYAQDLTSILVSEISKLGTFEVYSQENVRTLAGWAAEKMMLGCTDTKCLTALGQMDIAKLISGRVGKIGNRYSVSLNLFDTQNAKAEKAVSELQLQVEDIRGAGEKGVSELQVQAEGIRGSFNALITDAMRTASVVGEMKTMVKKGEESEKDIADFIAEVKAGLGRN